MSKKELCYSCISDLNKEIDRIKSKVKIVNATQCKQFCESANDIYKKAENHYKIGDEENSYILFMRYLFIVQTIQKTYEFQKSKGTFMPILAKGNINAALSKAENLNDSLSKRYEKKKTDIQTKKEIEQKIALQKQNSKRSVPTSSSNQVDLEVTNDLILPDVPSDDFLRADKSSTLINVNKDDRGQSSRKNIINDHNDSNLNKKNKIDNSSENNSIKEPDLLPTSKDVSVIDFYNLLKKYKKNSNDVLIIDVRASSEYEKSKITHSCVINIPKTLLQPGANINSIDRKIDKKTWPLWESKTQKRVIAIFDDDLNPESILNKDISLCAGYILQEILRKFKCEYEILLVIGGFKQWHLQFPTLTSDPHYMKETSKTIKNPLDLLKDLNYPELPNAFNNRKLPLTPGERNLQHPKSGIEQLETFSEVEAKKYSMENGMSKTISNGEKSKKPSESNDNMAPRENPYSSNSIAQNIYPSVTQVGDAKNLRVNSTDKLSEMRKMMEESNIADHEDDVVLPNQINEASKQNIMTEKGSINGHDNFTKNFTGKANVSINTVPKSPIAKSSVISNKGLEVKGTNANFLNRVTPDNRNISSQGPETKLNLTNTLNNYTIPTVPGVPQSKEEENMSLQTNKFGKPESTITKRTATNDAVSPKLLRNDNFPPTPKINNYISPPKTQINNPDPSSPRKSMEQSLPKVPAIKNVPSSPPVVNNGPDNISTSNNIPPSNNVHTSSIVNGTTPLNNIVVSQTNNQPLMPNLSVSGTLKTTTIHPDKHSKFPNVDQSNLKPSPEMGKDNQDKGKKKVITTYGLPHGWQKAISHETGRIYYIDHNTRTTHWKLPPDIQSQYVKKIQSEEKISKDSILVDNSAVEDNEKPKPSLKRSLSSPNLAEDLQKLQEKKIAADKPLIDRSQKPKEKQQVFVDRSSKPITANRLHNLAPVYGAKGPSLTGLKNLGNTCYMNSVIQCLLNSIPLSQYFITGTYEKDLNPKSPNVRPTELARELSFILKVLKGGEYRSVSPVDFKFSLGRFHSDFRGYEQQDSHELLMYLLGGLHEDINKGNSHQLVKERDIDNIPDVAAADFAWKDYLINNNSVIVDLFQGQFRSTVMCLTCRHKSRKFDAFNCLQLQLPSNQSVALESCINTFAKPERIGGDDGWKCTKCKCYREAAKTIEIWKLPPILIIQLKRFYFDGRWHNKIQTNVNFPIENLNMRSHVVAPSSNFLNYQLYGVINHYGSYESGHYTAYGENAHNNKWFLYDDNMIKDINKNSVKTNAAYVLFYKAIDFKEYLKR